MELVNMTLVGVDGNAFAVLGAFRKNALKQGWSKEEVSKVLEEAMSGDYSHLLSTICNNITGTDNQFEDEE